MTTGKSKHLLVAAIALLMLPLLAFTAKSGDDSAEAHTAAEAVEPTPSESEVYGIAFYNLENLFDTINNNGINDRDFTPMGARKWDTAKYRAKLGNLARAIAHMTTPETPAGPAIIGISEVENERVVRDLVNTEPLSSRNLKYVHHDSPDKRGIDVAMLYDPEMFQVLSVTNTPLTEIGFATRDQMAVTGVLAGTDTLTVVVCHWPSRLGGEARTAPARIAAGKLAKHIADSIWSRMPGTHVVVMGDLNDDPTDKSVSMIPGLGAKDKPKNVAKHAFYNPWVEIWEPDYRGTLSYQGRWNLFDQIIVSGTLLDNKKGRGTGRLVFCGAQINDFDFLKNPEGSPYAGTPHRSFASNKWLNGYSDHFPTEIFLKVRH